MDRRQFVTGLSGMFALGLLPAFLKKGQAQTKFIKSKTEWKALLPSANYRVLFEEDTELPFSSPLDKNYSPGTYICFACNQPLFESTTKYNSKTGWPSFYDHIPDALGTKPDYSAFFAARTEYHCSRCGGHQGHVFADGPPPTYKRYCNNGLALKFIPKGKKLPELVI